MHVKQRDLRCCIARSSLLANQHPIQAHTLAVLGLSLQPQLAIYTKSAPPKLMSTDSWSQTEHHYAAHTQQTTLQVKCSRSEVRHCILQSPKSNQHKTADDRTSANAADVVWLMY